MPEHDSGLQVSLCNLSQVPPSRKEQEQETTLSLEGKRGGYF